jgi:uncharacterized protein
MEGAIDCDVHCAPASIDELLPYMDEYWHEYVAGAGLTLSASLWGAYPDDREPPADVESLAEQVLDPQGLRYAVLNCLSGFEASRNLYYEAALASAINDWLREHWLDRDERLRASMVVPTRDPDAARREIERVGADPRFVQVLLPVRSDFRWGDRRFHPMYEAAAAGDLAIALHAWGRPAGAATTSGATNSFLEDYVGNSQIIVQGQVASLVAEGVFDAVPSLRVCLAECGFSWVPALLWRFDKDWKAVWREVPWVKERPSEYVRRHFRATTAPAQLPPNEQHVAELAEMLGARDFLLYASDYPHEHGDGGGELLMRSLDEEGRAAVMHGNAERFYGLA